MAPPGLWNILARVYFLYEDAIVRTILRSPTFHRGVRGVHRRVEDFRYGRDPSEPLRPGEATEDPTMQKSTGFLKHFMEELRNQIRGTSSGPPPPPSAPKR